ncbi:MAG: hypothetical protein ACTSX7_16620 [Alphaproteobacteria bacterium]
MAGQANANKLTYADFGVYGRAVCDYYTEPDTPFALYILQWHSGHLEVPNVLNEQIKKMHQMGRKVILYYHFWKSSAEKIGKEPLPSVADIMARMEKVLSTLDHQYVYGITLAEENVPYAGRGRLLHDVYGELKKRYPSVRFFQWYTAGMAGTPHFSPVPGFQAPLLGADGWIFDEYQICGTNFKRMLWKYHMLDVPFNCILWASCGWEPTYTRQNALEFADSQIEMMRRMNMSVALFAVNQFRDDEVVSDCWAWEMDDVVGAVAQDTSSSVSAPLRLERYRFNAADCPKEGLPTRMWLPTRKKFDRYARWARKAPKLAQAPDINDKEINFMGRKMPMKVEFDGQGDFTYRDSFQSLISRSGQHPLTGGSLMTRHADVSSAMDLRYDGYADDPAFRVRGVSGRDVKVSITYLFVSQEPMHNLQAKIRGRCRQDLGGDLGLAVSLDGVNWVSAQPPKAAAAAEWSGELVLDSSVAPMLQAEAYFQAYVRIDLNSTARRETDFSTFFNAIEVTAKKR